MTILVQLLNLSPNVIPRLPTPNPTLLLLPTTIIYCYIILTQISSSWWVIFRGTYNTYKVVINCLEHHGNFILRVVGRRGEDWGLDKRQGWKGKRMSGASQSIHDRGSPYQQQRRRSISSSGWKKWGYTGPNPPVKSMASHSTPLPSWGDLLKLPLLIRGHGINSRDRLMTQLYHPHFIIMPDQSLPLL